MVAELQLIGLETEGQAENLMTQDKCQRSDSGRSVSRIAFTA